MALQGLFRPYKELGVESLFQMWFKHPAEVFVFSKGADQEVLRPRIVSQELLFAEKAFYVILDD